MSKIPIKKTGALNERIETKYLQLSVLFVYLLVFMAIPISYIFYISFIKHDPYVIIGNEYTLEHYATLVFDSFYRSLMSYTVKLAFVVTVFSLLLGYPLGYYIARTTPLRRQLLLFLIFLPIMVGTVARTYGWIAILGTQGFLNDMLFALFGFRMSLLHTYGAVVVGLVGVLIPFVVLPVYSAVESIPRSYEKAARNLGANRFQAFYKVTFPLSLPGAITGSIFVFVLTMSSIVVPKLLGGRTDNTLGSIMYDLATADLNWTFSSAMAVVLSLITLTLLYLYLKLIREPLEGNQ